MSETCGKSRHHDERASSAPRETKCFDPGNIPSTLSLSSHSSSQKAQSTSSCRLRVPSMLDRARPDTSNWQLDPSIFQGINNKWVPFTKGLFASRLTAQSPKFVNWTDRSRGRVSECLYSGLEPAQRICFPSIFRGGV